MDWVRFGRGVRALRTRRGWRQVDLANAVRVSQSLVSRVERGRGDRLRAGTLERLAQALSARFSARIDWNGEALDRLLDERHAHDVEWVVAAVARLGWEAIPEATFSIWGERGSVDVLAWHAPTSTLLVCEVKSVVPDVQATLAALDRKVRLAPEIARATGWRPLRVYRLLVIEDSRTARRRVDEHAATFQARFPDRTVGVRRFLDDPRASPHTGGLWFLAPRTGANARHRVPGSASARRAPSAPISGPEVASESRRHASADRGVTAMRRSPR